MGAPVVAGVAVGAAAGALQSWIFAGGDPSKKQVVTGAILGAIPGGLGARGALQVGQKLSVLRHFRPSQGDKIRHIPFYFAVPQTTTYLGREAQAIALGMGGGYVIGELYDKAIESRSGGHIGRTDRVAGPPQTRKTMRGASAQKKSKKPKFVRYRAGGCPPGYTYDSKRKMCIHKSYR